MALDVEIKVIVKKLIMDLGFGDEFEKTFLEYLENESSFQCDEEDRMKVIGLLRDRLKEK